jgi:hypothetical protein
MTIKKNVLNAIAIKKTYTKSTVRQYGSTTKANEGSGAMEE